MHKHIYIIIRNSNNINILEIQRKVKEIAILHKEYMQFILFTNMVLNYHWKFVFALKAKLFKSKNNSISHQNSKFKYKIRNE